jgi:hypothetical protein
VSPQHLEIQELAAWGFDHPVDRGLHGEEQLRNAACHAHRRLAVRMTYPADSPISVEETRELAGVLATRKDTVALSGEFDGLAWELSIVDLRKLIAFQRRIGFAHHDRGPIHRGARLQQLLDLALPLHTLSRSPYMEVASYRGRWFLRDGYHRSFRLLKQGVYLVPCVVVYAESLAQMGAVGSRFFSQEILFSEQPPMVTDFLDEEVTVRYCRALPEQVMPFTIQQLQEPVAAGCRQQEVP